MFMIGLSCMSSSMKYGLPVEISGGEKLGARCTFIYVEIYFWGGSSYRSVSTWITLVFFIGVMECGVNQFIIPCTCLCCKPLWEITPLEVFSGV